MRILSLESSAGMASVALSNDRKIEGYAFQNAGLTHSKTLMPMIEDMLKNAGVLRTDIGMVAVAKGPGSFTGLRIGVSVAKGIAAGLGVPCVGVSTLEAMAWSVNYLDGVVCCAMDARRGEVYNAVFEVNGAAPVRMCGDRAIPAVHVVEELRNCKKKIFYIGDGAELCYNITGESENAVLLPPHIRFQTALGVAVMAQNAQSGDKDAESDPDLLVPHYIRISQAERERLERGKN